MAHDHQRWDDDGGHMGHPARLHHLKQRFHKAAEAFCADYLSHKTGYYTEGSEAFHRLLFTYRNYRDAH